MKAMAFWDKKDRNIKEFSIDNFKKNKIPILVLDKNWHYMFPPGRKTQKMLNLENNLNQLLKEQGRLINEEKDYNRFKKDCMNNIMELMEEAYTNENSEAQKNMSKSQKYIEQINNKIDNIEDKLIMLPIEIRNVNNELLNESINMCYSEMKTDKERVEQLDKEINELREELKDRIDEKTVKEEIIDRTYTFLHNLVGVDIINKIDKNNME